MGAVARDQQALIGNVESAGIEGDVELLLEVAAGGVLGGISAEVGRDVLPLSGRHIDFDQAAAAAARAVADAVDDVGIFGIGRDDAEFRGGQRAPVGEVDLAPVAAAADHDRAGVLLCSHDPVGILVVGGDVVDLRDGLGVPEAPGLAVVESDAGALVGADEHAFAVGGIDPELVVVLAAGRALEGLEGDAAVGGAVHGSAHGVKDVGVLRVHEDAASCRRPGRC